MQRTHRLALLALFLAACTAAAPTTISPAAAVATGLVTPQLYGAVCDGATDDRAPVQAALNSGAPEVRISGTCEVGQAGRGSWGVTMPAGVRLSGDPGALLQQLPGLPGSVRLIEVDAPGAIIEDLTLDGNAELQPLVVVDTKTGAMGPDEHRAGVFARAGTTLRNVVLQDFTGDGASLFTGADFTLDHVTATGNLRDGISCVGAVDRVLIQGSTLVGSHAQQLDLEPKCDPVTKVCGYCNHVTLRDSLLDGDGVSADFALAISHGDGFLVESSTINGPVGVVHSHGVAIDRSAVSNETPSPAVFVDLDADAEVRDSTVSSPNSKAVVELSGISGDGAQPSARLVRNTLTGTGQTAIVYAHGAAILETQGNVLTCTGLGALAIYARATLPAYPFGRVELRGDRAIGCARGLELAGDRVTLTPRIDELVTSGLDLAGVSAVLDADGAGALQFALLSGLSVARWPAGAITATAGDLTMMTRQPTVTVQR